MKLQPGQFLLAGLIAGLGLAANAQGSADTAPAAAQQQAPHATRHDGPHMEQRQRDRSAHMQERRARRLAELKSKLQVTPAQEDAWTAFTNAMQPNPAARQNMREAREEMKNLKTPERIDRMRALRAERIAAIDRRLDATKALYAQLAPEQQKVFDERTAKVRSRSHHGGRRGNGGDQHRHGS